MVFDVDLIYLNVRHTITTTAVQQQSSASSPKPECLKKDHLI